MGVIAGGLIYNSTINNCYTIGEISGYNSNWQSIVGGIVGDAWETASILHSHSACTVNNVVIESRSWVGGIAGRVTTTTIENCYSIGDINGGYYTGGISGGLNTHSVMRYCFST